MSRLFFLPLALTALLPVFSRADEPAPDLALSASFLPPRYVVDNPAQRERIRSILRALPRDSAQWFRMERNVLTLSHGLMERLAAEETEEADGDGKKGRARQRARARMERLAGAGIEEDAPVFAAGYSPNDFALQSTRLWPLANDGSHPGSMAGVDMGMDRVWEQFDGSDSLIVAVLDAGLNFHHPDLQGRWFVNPAEAAGIAGVDDDRNGFVDDVRGWDFVDGDNDPHDFHSHGTQVSGLIAAGFDNGTGIAGMLPRVRILPLRVLSTSGSGNSSDIANGIRYAAAMGAHVISFSIGVPGTATSTTLRNAFMVARDSGVIVSAAAANSSVNLDTATTQPASYKFANVYIVAAHNPNATLAGFSNYGVSTVDLAAPGVDIVTTSIPPPIPIFKEGFEDAGAPRWSFSGGSFQSAPDSMAGARSLRWVSGVTAIATLADTLNMRGRRGGLLRFRLHYQPAGSNDRLLLEIQHKGSPNWLSLVVAGAPVAGQTLAYALGSADDTLYRLRFRTCLLNTLGTTCVASGSTANRMIRIDDVEVSHADESPQNQAAYITTAGTSLAAPYFAGYAALMRLASARVGLPLTRERMLAGTVAEPALAGKVITGGRLDAAKGLDFYLRTLPRIVVTDTAHTEWNPGASVAYSLSVADSAGPRNDFTFGAVSLPPGGGLTFGGLFTWNSGGAPNGVYSLRVRAEKPPLVLRKLVRFGLGVPAAVAAAPGRESVLRIGNRAFLLPPSAFDRDLHALRIEFYAADGRTLQSVAGELVIPPGARNAEYRLQGFHGVGLRAWLNGIPLRPAPRD